MTIIGSSQEKTGSTEDAIQTYNSILPWLSSLETLSLESPLFTMWTERLLVRLCQLCDQSAETGEYLDSAEALQIYRFWSRYWETTGKGTGAEGMAPHRRSAWKAYYDSLSTVLRHELPYSVGSTSNMTEKTPSVPHSHLRLQQRAELKRVETIYETLLLKETQFPKASESNQETEAWTDAVMDNWRILCGPTWSDGDLGEGGKEAVGRGVLDVRHPSSRVYLMEDVTCLICCYLDPLPCSDKNISFYADTTASLHRSRFPGGVPFSFQGL